MKKIVPTLALLILSQFVFSQSAFHNNGNMQIHNGASIGFHTNLINNGNLHDNGGLVGFYRDKRIVVKGKNKAVLNDVEVFSNEGIYLATSIQIKNSLSLIEGNINTPRKTPDVSLEFINNSMHIGASDEAFVDGYSSMTGTSDFDFPVGDNNRLRMISIKGNSSEDTYSAAYFYESPEYGLTSNEEFDFNEKEDLIGNISKKEFWNLNGDRKVSVKLTWDVYSDISSLTDSINDLRVVGWNKIEQKWVDLGNTKVMGDKIGGSVISKPFVPSKYEIITIGTKFNPHINTEDSQEAEIVKTYVFDVAGNLVRIFDQDEQLSLNGYAKGIYILHCLLSNGDRNTKKVYN